MNSSRRLLLWGAAVCTFGCAEPPSEGGGSSGAQVESTGAPAGSTGSSADASTTGAAGMGSSSESSDSAGSETGDALEVCDNLIDDDLDDLLDCADPECVGTTPYCHRTTSSRVFFDEDSVLQYGLDPDGEHLVDFSQAGFHGGGVSIPTVDERAHVDPSGGDDTTSIQAAIASVALLPPGADGFRGAVVLGPGTFRISASVLIDTDGIVLRGSGASQTVVVHEGVQAVPSIIVSGENEFGDERVPILDDALPLGARAIHVEDASGLASGDEVFVRARRELAWLQALGMEEEWGGFLEDPGGFTIRLGRRVVSADVESGLVTLDAGMTDRISPALGHHGDVELVKVVDERRVAHVGVEDLTLISTYDRTRIDDTGSGYPIDHEHANEGVRFDYVVDGWVRRVATYYYGRSGVRIIGWTSDRITLEDIAVLDMVERDTPTNHHGGTKYGIDFSGNGTLAQRIFVRNSRHAFIVNGPRERNVVLDSYSELGHIACEPHQIWSTAILYDNVYCDSMFKLNRVEGSQHGHRAAHSVLYNVVSESPRVWEPEIWLDDAPQGLGRNHALGVELRGVGQGIASPAQEGGTPHLGEASFVEATDDPLRPRSLYLAQLWQRRRNEGILETTSQEQRVSREAVWDSMTTFYDQIPQYAGASDLGFLPDAYPFE